MSSAPDVMSTTSGAAKRPPFPVRVLDNLRSRGLRGTAELIKKKAFATDKLVLVRRELGPPGAAANPDLGEGIEIRRATPEDRELWMADWSHKVDWYIDRLNSGLEMAFLCLHEGELISHCWISLQSYRDEELAYTFQLPEGEGYLGEGWVRKDWRKRSIATAFLVELFERHMPAAGLKSIVCYRTIDNRAAEALHKKIGWKCYGGLRQVRIGKRKFYFERTKAQIAPHSY